MLRAEVKVIKAQKNQDKILKKDLDNNQDCKKEMLVILKV